MMTWDFFFRLLVAGVLGALVGIDREYRAKEAGFASAFVVAFEDGRSIGLQDALDKLD